MEKCTLQRKKQGNKEETAVDMIHKRKLQLHGLGTFGKVGDLYGRGWVLSSKTRNDVDWWHRHFEVTQQIYEQCGNNCKDWIEWRWFAANLYSPCWPRKPRRKETSTARLKMTWTSHRHNICVCQMSINTLTYQLWHTICQSLLGLGHLWP